METIPQSSLRLQIDLLAIRKVSIENLIPACSQAIVWPGKNLSDYVEFLHLDIWTALYLKSLTESHF